MRGVCVVGGGGVNACVASNVHVWWGRCCGLRDVRGVGAGVGGVGVNLCVGFNVHVWRLCDMRVVCVVGGGGGVKRVCGSERACVAARRMWGRGRGGCYFKCVCGF